MSYLLLSETVYMWISFIGIIKVDSIKIKINRNEGKRKVYKIVFDNKHILLLPRNFEI